MQNQRGWKETKFSLKEDELHVNKDFLDLGIQSWIITECVASLYSYYLPKFAKGDTLDLGCGMCPLYGLYRQYATSVFCVDWENSLHKNPYIDLACDISKTIPLADHSFDTIILSDVLEHIPNPQQLINESYRLLNSNGVLILNVPFFYWIHEAPHDFFRYTEFCLKEYLLSSGFELEVFEIVGGSIEAWADLTSKLLSYVPILRKVLPLLLFQSVFAIKRVNYIRKKLIGLDQVFPLGYFVIAQKI